MWNLRKKPKKEIYIFVKMPKKGHLKISEISQPWKVFCEEMEVKYYRDNIPSYMICADEEDTQWAGDWVKK